MFRGHVILALPAGVVLGQNLRLIFIVKAVLFDCDGVIADSEELWNDIDHTVLAQFGVPDYYGQHKEHVLGRSFAISSGFYRDLYKIEASVEEIVECRTQVGIDFYTHKIPMFPGAKSVLEQLKADGFKLALATSTVSRMMMPFLQRCEIDGLFDVIITGERVKNGKPHPDIYLLAAEAVDTPPAQCLVVEDALAGLQAGRSAGAITVAIPDARWLDPAFFEGNADYIINNVSEVVPLARRLAG